MIKYNYSAYDLRTLDVCTNIAYMKLEHDSQDVTEKLIGFKFGLMQVAAYREQLELYPCSDNMRKIADVEGCVKFLDRYEEESKGYKY
jgi:hypothetical protein